MGFLFPPPNPEFGLCVHLPMERQNYPYEDLILDYLRKYGPKTCGDLYNGATPDNVTYGAVNCRLKNMVRDGRLLKDGTRYSPAPKYA